MFLKPLHLGNLKIGIDSAQRPDHVKHKFFRRRGAGRQTDDHYAAKPGGIERSCVGNQIGRDSFFFPDFTQAV